MEPLTMMVLLLLLLLLLDAPEVVAAALLLLMAWPKHGTTWMGVPGQVGSRRVRTQSHD